jgi:hypothetical protein
MHMKKVPRTSLRKLPRQWAPPVHAHKRGRVAAFMAAADPWLSRGSHLAQVVLMAATIAGFYFTVVPLYQKAALEEQIAKREIELKSAEAAVRKAEELAYRRERRDAVAAVWFPISTECSGVFVALTFKVSGDIDRSDDPLPGDIVECVRSKLDKGDLSKLRAVDVAHLRSQGLALSQSLESLRIKARNEISEIPSLPVEELAKFAPEREVERTVDEYLSRVQSPDATAERRRTAAVRRAQRAIGASFREAAAKQLGALVRMEWPSDQTATN